MPRLDRPFVSRALLIAGLLILAVGSARAQPQNCGPFDDVVASHPFCADIQWVYNRSITLGCSAPAGQQQFCPTGFVTREQMAAFLSRLGRDLDAVMCRGVDPSCCNDWVATRENRVPLFTRTAGPRHAAIGSRLAGLNPPRDAAHVAQSSLITLLRNDGIAVDWTEDVTRLTNSTATGP